MVRVELMASDCDVAGPELQPLSKLLLFLLTVSVSELKLNLKPKFHWMSVVHQVIWLVMAATAVHLI